MADRPARSVAAYLACMLADAALVVATIVVWWKPTFAEHSSLYKAAPWGVDACSGATFAGVAISLTIAAAILVIAGSLPRGPIVLRVVSISFAILTTVAVLLPWVDSAFSNCQA